MERSSKDWKDWSNKSNSNNTKKTPAKTKIQNDNWWFPVDGAELDQGALATSVREVVRRATSVSKQKLVYSEMYDAVIVKAEKIALETKGLMNSRLLIKALSQDAIAEKDAVIDITALIPGLVGVYVDTIWERRAYGPHKAVDIPCIVGTEIYSVGSGEVTLIQDFGLNKGGLVMEVNYPKTNVTLSLMHLSETIKKVGDKIAVGDLLALSGTSGLPSPAPHLHLKVSVSGEVINPNKLFRLMKWYLPNPNS